MNGQENDYQQNDFWNSSIIPLLRVSKFTKKEYSSLRDIALYTRERHGDEEAAKALAQFIERGDFSAFSGKNSRAYILNNFSRLSTQENNLGNSVRIDTADRVFSNRTNGFLKELSSNAVEIMNRRAIQADTCIRSDITHDYEEIFFSKKIISFLNQNKFVNSSIYETFRKSILDTWKDNTQKYGKEYAEVLTIDALKRYILNGDFSRFSGADNRKQIGMNTYSRDAQLFLSAVTRKCVEQIEHEPDRVAQLKTSKPRETREIRRPTTSNQKYRTNTPKEANNGIYVVSDLHGDMKQLNKVKQHIRMGQKVVVLGDATDRGPDGIEIIQEIMRMQKSMQQNGQSLIEYVPGNHDMFLYETLYEGMKYNDIGRIIRACDERLNSRQDQQNGLTPTYSKLKYLAQTNPQAVFEIGRWLGKQPLQRIEEDRGKRIALGHAAFDMDLYRSGYTLENYMNDRMTSQNSSLRAKAFICLWYRNADKNSEFDNEVIQDASRYLKLPDESIAQEIVIGHTPLKYRRERENVELIGNNRTRQAICVDRARHGKVENYTMGAYFSRKTYGFGNSLDTILADENDTQAPLNYDNAPRQNYYNSPTNWPVTGVSQEKINGCRGFLKRCLEKIKGIFQPNNNQQRDRNDRYDNYR